MVKTFREFVGNKKRQSKRQLRVILKALKHGGLKVDSFLKNEFEEPYIYCYNPDKNTSFRGIRVYGIGDKIAYRVQRENDTHPYGTAYLLDVDEIFNDLMSDGVTKKERLGQKTVEEIVKVVRAFFEESANAEKEEDKWGDDDAMGMVYVRNPMGGDYSSQVQNRN